ncbi:MAG: hypothetical protein ACM3WV_07860 [Bacillota bacterium]
MEVRRDLPERSFKFAVQIVNLCRKLDGKVERRRARNKDNIDIYWSM